MANDHLKARFSEEDLPYVIFLRTYNENLGDKFEGVVELKDQEWKCVLANENGNVYIWAGAHQMQKYLSKGWRIIGSKNLEAFEQYEGIREILNLVNGHKKSFDEIEATKKELLAAKKEIEALKAKRGKLQDEQKA